MTFGLLNRIIEENNIPEGVTLMSDSGWECDATEMDGVYYNSESNIIVFTRYASKYDSYQKDNKWKMIYSNDSK